MKLAQKSEERIQNILKIDKEKVSSSLISLIKSDIYSLLNNYFEIKFRDLKVSYYVDENSKYQFDIKFSSTRIKKVNFL